MIYLKLFILYSHLGFIFESFVFKLSNTNKHSGVLIGPYTLVYGLGGILCYYLSKHLNNLILEYLAFTLCTTLVELITGHLINFIFHFDSWNYSYKRMHIGKYISFDYAFIWGVLALIFVKYLNNFFNEIISLIPNTFFIIEIIIIIIDLLITFFYTKEKSRLN